MNEKNINISFDLSTITHFLLFMYFGYIYPKKIIYFICASIIWELLEDFLAQDENTKLVDCKLQKGTFWCNGIQNGSWNGKAEDILVNIYVDKGIYSNLIKIIINYFSQHK